MRVGREYFRTHKTSEPTGIDFYNQFSGVRSMCAVCKHFRSTMKTVKTNKNKICCDEKKSVERAKGGDKKKSGNICPFQKILIWYERQSSLLL